jgi:hypothetical protein
VKRLSPIDETGIGGPGGIKVPRTGSPNRQPPAPADESPSEPARCEQCALPIDPDPRRTAFYALVAESEDGLLYVREAPIEILPVRDTELAHVAYQASAESLEEILVTVTPDTCFDVTRPYQFLEPNTPVIVVGLDLGVAIAAEIIAGMEEEPRYRPLLMRHQKSRRWYNLSHNPARSRRPS